MGSGDIILQATTAATLIIGQILNFDRAVDEFPSIDHIV